MKRPPVLAWLRLARVFQRLERALVQQLRAWDLSLAQFDLLAHVGAAEGLTQQELADRLLVTKGNVCQLLEKLERRGLVVRRPEGRANRLFLTPAGRALFQ
ncbi:MAG TPA: MarR family transcriptional regulator, partial [Dehalococcoidia bacterium]